MTTSTTEAAGAVGPCGTERRMFHVKQRSELGTTKGGQR